MRPPNITATTARRIDGAIRFSFDGRNSRTARARMARSAGNSRSPRLVPGALSAPMCDRGLWRPIFWGFWETSRITVATALESEALSPRFNCTASASPRSPLRTAACAVNGNWRIVGAQVEDVDDSTVRGVIIDCPDGRKIGRRPAPW